MFLLQMLSDVISKSYEELKREVEDGNVQGRKGKKRHGRKGRHKPAIQGRKPKRAMFLNVAKRSWWKKRAS